MLIVLKLHTDMFAGLPGKLFLGGMGLLFLAAIISGVVLYWPFTRRLQFGTIRQAQTRRVVWLDWHNLIGITTIVWALAVGGTGAINTWAELMLENWRTTELASMLAPYAGTRPPAHLASLDLMFENAMAAAPGMEVAFIAFPGTPFSSSHHFAAFMRGNRPLTSRLLKPVLPDGSTAKIADTRELPSYLKALFISQPLHFGDYGGMPLKIIWALLDALTIAVIGSRLYLWLVKWRRSRRGLALSAALATEAGNALIRAVDTSLRRVFCAPIVLGLPSLSGLVTALLSAGVGRYFAWIAVASPLIVTLWFGVRQFCVTATRARMSHAASTPAVPAPGRPHRDR